MTAERLALIEERLARRTLDPVGWAQGAPSDVAFLLALARARPERESPAMNETTLPHGAPTLDIEGIRELTAGQPTTTRVKAKKGLSLQGEEIGAEDEQDEEEA